MHRRCVNTPKIRTVRENDPLSDYTFRGTIDTMDSVTQQEPLAISLQFTNPIRQPLPHENLTICSAIVQALKPYLIVDYSVGDSRSVFVFHPDLSFLYVKRVILSAYYSFLGHLDFEAKLSLHFCMHDRSN
jgi:hypothetical protein